MKTKIFLACTLFTASIFTFACKEKTTDKVPTEPETAAVTETIDDLVLDTSDDPILLGKTKRSELHMEPYSKWFTPTYKDYVVDTATVSSMGRKLRDAHLTIFMGTWCEDSQLQIPALYKVLDEAGFNPNHYTLITVSEEKDTPKGLEKGKNITNVPTVIVNMDGEELGRIVEYPIESLEKDLEKILNNESYKHAYEE
jgi:thiol-disulfide isomerase/thioredoxin